MGIYDFVQRGPDALSNVDRWATFPTVADENVAEHTYEVMSMAHLFALDMKRDETDRDPNVGDVLEKALYHDIEEAATGDIPRWAKRETEDLESALDSAEESMVDALFEPLGESVSSYLKWVWSRSKDDTIEGRIIAAADILAAIQGVHEEQKLGNKALADTSDIQEGVDAAYDIVEGIEPAEEYLFHLLREMEGFEPDPARLNHEPKVVVE